MGSPQASFLSQPLFLCCPHQGTAGSSPGRGSRGRLGEGPGPAAADTGRGTDEDEHWALGSGSYFCALENWEQTDHTRVCQTREAVNGRGGEQKKARAKLRRNKGERKTTSCPDPDL